MLRYGRRDLEPDSPDAPADPDPTDATRSRADLLRWVI